MAAAVESLDTPLAEDAVLRVTVLATCSCCGAILREGDRFCTGCGTPQTMEAAAERLGDLLAKDAGIARDDPRLQAALARVRNEEPEAWNALLKKIGPRATA
ncbi:zinc ribbon domain-containing protein [Methanoculleus chikugoensis]|uniref:Zinc ribbon domain-containing protein n=1 Tax=Methanoculleus chikugoensis TaxID=118126 RepID=A0ABN5XHU7_9EURY|nr:zinc ribbon domain-containing protein [Methanoculleus chikugoensis]BBL68122.1 hypothetical protein MchiMG62_13030 [Methanoculleus chikugoensis]